MDEPQKFVIHSNIDKNDYKAGDKSFINGPKKLDTTKLKRTNRLTRSCSSCKKRKVKCNFEIPCDRCIARNRAHLCTRDPVIFDGLLVNVGDEKELKYSQENEVLKKKIKQLEDTIIKLKSDGTDVSCDNDGEIDNPIHLNNNHSKKKKNDSLNKHDVLNKKKWDSYSITISLLDKELANGLTSNYTDDSTEKQHDRQLEYNTEEWLNVENLKIPLTVRSMGDRVGNIWGYQIELVGRLTRKESEILVNKGLELSFLYPVIEKTKFREDFELYWNDDSIKEKHITPLYSQTKKKYLFLGQCYALMCIGIYYCEDEVRRNFEFNDQDWEILPKAFFSSALECLYRGRFMTHLDLKSIQLINLLKVSANSLGGVNLLNCLMCVSTFLGKKLKLNSAGDNFLKTNNWWSLIDYDWFENQGRYSLIDTNSFDINNLPDNFAVDKTLNWQNYYLLFSIKITTIKKKYYFDDSTLTLGYLKKADIELRLLDISINRDFESVNNTSGQIEFLKYLTQSILIHEILEVNRKMSSFMTYEEWHSQCYKTCYNSSTELIRQYASHDIPFNYKKPSIVPENVISAAVFLLVDCMLNRQIVRYQKETIYLVRRILPILSSYPLVVRPAIRGIYVIQKLISLMLGEDKESCINGLKMIGRKSCDVNLNPSAEPFLAFTESNQTSKAKNNVPESVREAGKTLEDAESGKYGEYGEYREYGEYEEEEEEEEEEENSKVPLYYHIHQQRQIHFQQLLQQQQIQFPVQNQQSQDQQTYQLPDSPSSITLNNSTTTRMLQKFNHQQQNQMLMLSPIQNHPTLRRTDTAATAKSPAVSASNSTNASNLEDVEFLKNRTASPSETNNCESPINPPQNFDNQPHLHTTIMDILGDNGWGQFLGSIDDFNLSFDVK